MRAGFLTVRHRSYKKRDVRMCPIELDENWKYQYPWLFIYIKVDRIQQHRCVCVDALIYIHMFLSSIY